MLLRIIIIQCISIKMDALCYLCENTIGYYYVYIVLVFPMFSNRENICDEMAQEKFVLVYANDLK